MKPKNKDNDKICPVCDGAGCEVCGFTGENLPLDDEVDDEENDEEEL